MEEKKDPMDYFFEKLKENNVKIVFGLEAQGHIPTIEEELKKREDHHSKDVWEEIGKKIGWDSFTACTFYFNYREEKLESLLLEKGSEILRLRGLIDKAFEAGKSHEYHNHNPDLEEWKKENKI
jgi:hypothetical protein